MDEYSLNRIGRYVIVKQAFYILVSEQATIRSNTLPYVVTTPPLHTQQTIAIYNQKHHADIFPFRYSYMVYVIACPGARRMMRGVMPL